VLDDSYCQVGYCRVQLLKRIAAKHRNVLTLRALLHSERLDAFWARLSRRYTARVDAA